MTETAFFEAIGERFDHLDCRHAVINADVLDAWFPPAPGVLATLQDNLEWATRTSPPTRCDGLRAAIADARGVSPEHVLLGAGSSDLMYRAITGWLTPHSRVLILDPCYGEYAHVAKHIVGCTVDRVELHREDGWAPDLERLATQLERGRYDLFVLVNPNNPTGFHLSRATVAELLERVPATTTVWIDEAYLEYVAPGESLERLAAASANVFVCKSMSKVFALSGMRVAYLVGPADEIARLHSVTPPWVVGLPAQIAALRALEDLPYYMKRWRETSTLRARLTGMLKRIPGIEDVTGSANFLLVHLAPDAPDADQVLSYCRSEHVYLADVRSTSARFGSQVFRTAVKNTSRNSAIAASIARAIGARFTATSFAHGSRPVVRRIAGASR